MARGHSGSSRSGGSRGGSSFGGGARSHRSSISSSSRSHTTSTRSHYSSGPSHYHHGPHYRHHHRTSIYIGGRSYPASPLTVGIVCIFFAMFIALIFLFVNVTNRSMMIDELKEVERSYTYYQNMISHAEQNPEYQVEGEIDGIYYDYIYDRYYIEYSVNNPMGHSIISEASFAMYDYEQTLNMKKGDKIYIAVDAIPVQYDTDSINMDYKNISLEEDADYILVKSDISYYTRIVIILAISEGLALALVVFLIVKNSKKKNDKEETETTSTTTPSTTPSQTENDNYCDYCGSKLPDNSNKCPLCGAHSKK